MGVATSPKLPPNDNKTVGLDEPEPNARGERVRLRKCKQCSEKRESPGFIRGERQAIVAQNRLLYCGFAVSEEIHKTVLDMHTKHVGFDDNEEVE